MSDDDPFLTWLRYHKCRGGLVNSYSFALFSHNYGAVQLEGSFKMPLYIFIKELESEEANQGASEKIREYLVRLLKLALPGDTVLYSNYDDVLGEFLGRARILPQGVDNPLQPGDKFHSLPSEIKFWILYTLLQYSGQVVLDTPLLLGTDDHANSYFFVNGGRLYVEYGKFLNEMAKDDRQAEEHVSSLELYLRRKNTWKLLAETEKLWKNVPLILENFDEDRVARTIGNKREAAMRMILTEEEMRMESDEFEAYFMSIKPVAQIRKKTLALGSQVAVEPPPPYSSVARQHYPVNGGARQLDDFSPQNLQTTQNNGEEDRGRARSIGQQRNGRARSQSRYRYEEENRPSEQLNHPLSGMNLHDIARASPIYDNINNNRFSKKNQRCFYFPTCSKTADQCDLFHPNKPCSFGLNCRNGRECLFLHGLCPIDGGCGNVWCIFEHRNQPQPRVLAMMTRR